MTIIAIPIRFGNDLVPPTPLHSELGRASGRVPNALRHADTLGLKLPAEVAEHYNRAVALWQTKATARRVSVDDVTQRLADGTATLAELEDAVRQARAAEFDDQQSVQMRTRAIGKAAAHAYVLAGQTLAAAAADIYDQLNTLLTATITEAAQYDYLVPPLQDRYETIHDSAENLRYAVGSVKGLYPGAASADWWRFARPDLVHAWRLAQIGDGRSSFRGHRPTASVAGTGTSPTGERIEFVAIAGSAPPNVHDAANHPDWGPYVALPTDVLAAANNIDRALVAA